MHFVVLFRPSVKLRGWYITTGNDCTFPSHVYVVGTTVWWYRIYTIEHASLSNPKLIPFCLVIDLVLLTLSLNKFAWTECSVVLRTLWLLSRATESMVLCVCLLVQFTFLHVPAEKLVCTVWKCNASVTGFSVSHQGCNRELFPVYVWQPWLLHHCTSIVVEYLVIIWIIGTSS